MSENYGLTPLGGHIAENSWRLHKMAELATGLSASDNGDLGITRDDKDDLLTTIHAMLLATGEAGAREIPKP